jgi:hypothetical protein
MLTITGAVTTPLMMALQYSALIGLTLRKCDAAGVVVRGTSISRGLLEPTAALRSGSGCCVRRRVVLRRA